MMLNLFDKELTELPLDNLEHVTHLNCWKNNIKVLPDLSNYTKLTELDCSFNQLTTLPRLPQSLTFLRISNNKIHHINLAYLTNLKILFATLNKIETLILPDCLEELYCIDFDGKYDIPYSLKLHTQHDTIDMVEEKLKQYNKKRLGLDLRPVYKFPNLRDWKIIHQNYIDSLYEPGGEKFLESQANIAQLLST